MPDFNTILTTYVVPWGLKLLLAIVIWIVGFAVASWLGKLIARAIRR